jgi:hypothetical protein
MSFGARPAAARTGGTRISFSTPPTGTPEGSDAAGTTVRARGTITAWTEPFGAPFGALRSGSLAGKSVVRHRQAIFFGHRHRLACSRGNEASLRPYVGDFKGATGFGPGWEARAASLASFRAHSCPIRALEKHLLAGKKPARRGNLTLLWARLSTAVSAWCVRQRRVACFLVPSQVFGR